MTKNLVFILCLCFVPIVYVLLLLKNGWLNAWKITEELSDWTNWE
jgi:hypothetical protein